MRQPTYPRPELPEDLRADSVFVNLDGDYSYLTDGYYLRSAIMNPLIEPADFDDLLDHLRLLCRE